MIGNNRSIYYFAKFSSRELLLEDLVFTRGGNTLYYLERYERNPKRFKVKVVFTKLFLVVIFGVIPILPYSTYLEIVELLLFASVPVENIYFLGGLLFSLYFVLQNLNFFVMGLLDATMLISGQIFEWYESLPISKEKLMKVSYLTLFRSYDLPILVSFLAFPITMLIGSGNVIFFLICLGVSFVNVLISFSILILLAERVNRNVDVNDSSSKKTLILRIFNLFSYALILFGSYALIQWFTNSIDTISDFFVISGNRPVINLILSFIPFPFNLSYVIVLFMAPFQASFQLWFSAVIGFALMCILTYWFFTRSYKAIERVTLSEVTLRKRKKKRKKPLEDIKVEISSRKPFFAYLYQDFFMMTRNAKSMLTIIMPIVLSFVYVLTVNIENVININLLNVEYFLNWILLSIFSPFLSSLLVFGLTHLESAGEAILGTLPIDPRDQAKPKMLLMFFLLTCAIILPSLSYINYPNFVIILINCISTLPYAWFVLIVVFLLKIRLFGRKRKKVYLLEDFNPRYRIYKWVIIVSVPYLIFTLLLFFIISVFSDINAMMIFFWTVIILLSPFLYLLFNKLLPKFKK
jgi:predicted permease